MLSYAILKKIVNNSQFSENHTFSNDETNVNFNSPSNTILLLTAIAPVENGII